MRTKASSTSTIRATISRWSANTCRSLRPCALAIGGGSTCAPTWCGTGFKRWFAIYTNEGNRTITTPDPPEPPAKDEVEPPPPAAPPPPPPYPFVPG